MFDFLKYLGKFHPVIIHLPIGVLYFTFLLAISEKFIKKNFSDSIRIGLVFSFVFAILSCILGYLLSLSGDYGKDTLNLHMWLGISTAIFNGFLLWVYTKKMSNKYFVNLFGFTIILLTVTGHFGGSMTHGEDYLKLPETKNENLTSLKDSINLYTEVIRPVLDNKCVKCHNPSKSKGKLMLVSQKDILNGGKSGKIFKAFDSNESIMYKYSTLPLEDKLHMPPKGNIQLTDIEIKLLKNWIDLGGSFEKFVNPSQMEPYLKEHLVAFFPKEERIINPPKPKDLIGLQNLNFRLERNSSENNYIDAKFLGKKLESKHINALLKIKNQLIKLDLSGTNLNDKLITKLERLENLKFLKINATQISDKGLKYISKSIESLNLNNTNLSYNGIITLKENKNIKNIYLWNTKISSKNQEMLQNQFSATLNFGVKDFANGIPLLQPVLITEKTLFSDSLKIEFYKAPGNPEIRYTTNGKDPDSLSSLYTNPFFINKSLTLKAKSFKNGWQNSKVLSTDYFETGAVFDRYKLLVKPSKTYSNPQKLFDGVLGSVDFRDGSWNGFQKEKKEDFTNPNPGNMVVEIDIPKNNKISAIGINVLTSMNSYITLPERIELYDISEGKDILISYKNIPKEDSSANPEIKMYSIPLKNKNISKIKLIVKSNKKLPKGHAAQGEYAWLFVSEIIGLL